MSTTIHFVAVLRASACSSYPSEHVQRHFRPPVHNRMAAGKHSYFLVSGIMTGPECLCKAAQPRRGHFRRLSHAYPMQALHSLSRQGRHMVWWCLVLYTCRSVDHLRSSGYQCPFFLSLVAPLKRVHLSVCGRHDTEHNETGDPSEQWRLTPLFVETVPSNVFGTLRFASSSKRSSVGPHCAPGSHCTHRLVFVRSLSLCDVFV